MKKVLAFTVLLVALSVSTQAQTYKHAIGLRGGEPSGVTFKSFLNHNNAIEAIAGWGYGFDNFLLTGLYEFEKPTGWAPNLDWYIGFGAHLGFWNQSQADYYESGIVLGADVVGGLEYTLDDIPLNMAIDLIPSFDIIGGNWFHFKAGISFRYVF
jgi:hypothetical protein